MKITLEYDDEDFTKVSGALGQQLFINELFADPAWWIGAAKTIQVSGNFGVRTFDQSDLIAATVKNTSTKKEFKNGISQ